MKIADPLSAEPDLRNLAWIRDLARPYLKGFSPSLIRDTALRGCRFSVSAGPRRKSTLGFFAGFLLADSGYEDLQPRPPECLVFAFIHPVAGPLHYRLVAQPDSLLRRTYAHIGYLTHRPPRFQFFDSAPVALVRHVPLAQFHSGRYAHYSRNFYIETLAWLVRSALVRRLAAESTDGQWDTAAALL